MVPHHQARGVHCLEAPLLEDPRAGPGAEPDPHGPSAPPPPTILLPEELESLRGSLQAGRGELPSPAQLRRFRAETCGRLLWVVQMRQLASEVDGGRYLFQEAYERQLLADPQNLAAGDGPWVQAMWQAMPEAGAAQGAQALLSPLTVIRHDGRVATISVDMPTMNVAQAMELAAQQFGDCLFDGQRHRVFVVGAEPTGPRLKIGAFVKITGLVRPEGLNGVVGQVTGSSGDQYNVVTPAGVHALHGDNVVPHMATVVLRNRGFEAPLDSPLDQLGPPAPRLLWAEPAERQPDGPAASSGGGVLGGIRAQFRGMDVDGDGFLSAGELRNFLWNLHLDDAGFEQVRARFATAEPPVDGGARGGQGRPPPQPCISVDHMVFLLGRPHILSPGVPVDALVYEAVVSILGRRTTAHIDRDLSQADAGVGCRHACASHCPSYTVSLLLQGVVLGSLAAFLALGGAGGGAGTQDVQHLGWIALAAYAAYLAHLLCCVRLTAAFGNETQGLEQVMALMDRPRHENPCYNWRVQCYHYVTRTYRETVRDSDGHTRTVTKTSQERVNTHSAYASGTIPSSDATPVFVPQTTARQSQINTHLDLDFSQSNYHEKYRQWCWFHRRDAHQDCSLTEELSSRATSCLAVWLPNSSPWWLNSTCYWLANIFLLSFFYRLCAQAQIGEQEYTYSKKCYSI